MSPSVNLPYLRHKHGGGKLFDDSEACEQSFVDRQSVVSDRSSVWLSKIIASRITSSVVSGAVVKNSSISYSNVHGGMIDSSVIACEYVGGNSKISGSVVLGQSRVGHRAVCENVRFRDLTVKGSAVLKHWTQTSVFEGCHGYVSRGVWTRPPRIFKVSPTITVTEGVPGFAFVHCYELPIGHWLKCGHRYGRQSNWTPDEVKAVRKIMHLLQRYQHVQKSQ